MGSRRRFIGDLGRLAAVVGCAPALAAGDTLAAAAAPLGELGFEVFAARVDQVFRMAGAGRAPIALRLVSAEPVPAAHGEQFLLVFRGPPEPCLRQDTYWFEQESIGRFPMFIAPTARPEHRGAWYTAVFNRLRKPGPRAGREAGKPIQA